MWFCVACSHIHPEGATDNLNGCYAAMRALLPQYVEPGRVNQRSAHGVCAVPGFARICAKSFGLSGQNNGWCHIDFPAVGNNIRQPYKRVEWLKILPENWKIEDVVSRLDAGSKSELLASWREYYSTRWLLSSYFRVIPRPVARLKHQEMNCVSNPTLCHTPGVTTICRTTGIAYDD